MQSSEQFIVIESNSIQDNSKTIVVHYQEHDGIGDASIVQHIFWSRTKASTIIARGGVWMEWKNGIYFEDIICVRVTHKVRLKYHIRPLIL